MIEMTILKHLDQKVSVPVLLEKPDKLIATYVLFEKTGSGTHNHLPSSTFAFQSYAGSMADAAKLNTQVIDGVNSLIELDVISGVKLNSDYNYTDTTTKQYRYQAVFDIKHY